MRPQNAFLQILNEENLAQTQKPNGIFLFETGSQLQLMEFKNAKFFGERVFDLPEVLDKKVRAYLNIVRPIFGNFVFPFISSLLILIAFSTLCSMHKEKEKRC
mgnify:CR=1 FL=1